MTSPCWAHMQQVEAVLGSVVPASVRKQVSAFEAAFVPGQDATAGPQAPLPAGPQALNLIDTYMHRSKGFDQMRELTQNWMDRCSGLASSLGGRPELDGVPVHGEAHGFYGMKLVRGVWELSHVCLGTMLLGHTRQAVMASLFESCVMSAFLPCSKH